MIANKVTIITIATNRYKYYAEDLLKSIADAKNENFIHFREKYAYLI
jgi:hypothetical protein